MPTGTGVRVVSGMAQVNRACGFDIHRNDSDRRRHLVVAGRSRSWLPRSLIDAILCRLLAQADVSAAPVNVRCEAWSGHRSERS